MKLADTLKEKMSGLESKHFYIIGGFIALVIIIIVGLVIMSGFPAQRFGNTRHYGEVAHLVFEPDGGKLASSELNEKARVIVWNSSTGEMISEFDGNAGDSSFIAFSEDKEVLITAGLDEHVYFWDLSSGSKRREDTVELSATSAISPDGKWLAYVKGPKTFIWDISMRQTYDEYDGGATGERAIEFSPDSSFLATGDGAGILRIYEPENKNLRIPPKEAHASAIDCLAFNNKSDLIATGSRDNSAKLWDASGVEKAVFNGHESSIIAIAVGPDGKHILTGSRDNTARLWNGESGNELFKFENFRGTPESLLDISADGTLAAIETKSSSIEIFETASGTCIKKFESPMTTFKFSLTGARLFIGTSSGKIYTWTPEMK